MTNLSLKITTKVNRFIVKFFLKKIRKFKSNRSCYISFSFDDFPKSSVSIGGKILSQNNLKGTYYASPGVFNKMYYGKNMVLLSDLNFLIEKKHEIGCHTYDHSVFDKVSNKAIKHSIDKNIYFFRREFPEVSLGNFAYPRGSVNLYGKYLINKKYSTARTTEAGINRGKMDVNLLKANRLYSKTVSLDRHFEMIDDCKKNGGWLIFYTHDVDFNPSKFGCDPGYFKSVVSYAIKKEVEILSIKDVVKILKK
jgi:peptidoglycan/xylan/chitin deacetylase (PgdA/CDA1 family)